MATNSNSGNRWWYFLNINPTLATRDTSVLRLMWITKRDCVLPSMYSQGIALLNTDASTITHSLTHSHTHTHTHAACWWSVGLQQQQHLQLLLSCQQSVCYYCCLKLLLVLLLWWPGLLRNRGQNKHQPAQVILWGQGVKINIRHRWCYGAKTEEQQGSK